MEGKGLMIVTVLLKICSSTMSNTIKCTSTFDPSLFCPAIIASDESWGAWS